MPENFERRASPWSRRQRNSRKPRGPTTAACVRLVSAFDAARRVKAPQEVHECLHVVFAERCVGT